MGGDAHPADDGRDHFDDSLIDGGCDAAGYTGGRDDLNRDADGRPWPRPLPTAPPPSGPDDEAPRRIVRVINSLFPHKKPTVFFDYPSYVGG